MASVDEARVEEARVEEAPWASDGGARARRSGWEVSRASFWHAAALSASAADAPSLAAAALATAETCTDSSSHLLVCAALRTIGGRDGGVCLSLLRAAKTASASLSPLGNAHLLRLLCASLGSAGADGFPSGMGAEEVWVLLGGVLERACVGTRRAQRHWAAAAIRLLIAREQREWGEKVFSFTRPISPTCQSPFFPYLTLNFFFGFFLHSTHFSHMSEPILPTSHLEFLFSSFFCFSFTDPFLPYVRAHSSHISP